MPARWTCWAIFSNHPLRAGVAVGTAAEVAAAVLSAPAVGAAAGVAVEVQAGAAVPRGAAAAAGGAGLGKVTRM